MKRIIRFKNRVRAGKRSTPVTPKRKAIISTEAIRARESQEMELWRRHHARQEPPAVLEDEMTKVLGKAA